MSGCSCATDNYLQITLLPCQIEIDVLEVGTQTSLQTCKDKVVVETTALPGKIIDQGVQGAATPSLSLPVIGMPKDIFA